jgi:hypothetical protein
MKVEIPQELKSDVPQTTFGKVLSATPVVMAVLATMLAGLANSEITRAQYGRSLAAQQQSKAGDQWGFFQAKRLRGAVQRNTVDLLLSTSLVRPFDPDNLRSAAERASGPAAAEFKNRLVALIDSPAGQQTMSFLQKDQLPEIPAGEKLEQPIQNAIDAVEAGKPEVEVSSYLAMVPDQTLDNHIRAARDRAKAFDEKTRPINETLESIYSLLSKNAVLLQADGAKEPSAAARDFNVARLRFASQRYDVEARLNQAVANLYELQVRKSNTESERHRIRSQRFFYGMLGAQTGVILSTLAMAARKRNFLWSIAAAAGLIAFAFAIYVYLYV